MTHRNVWLSLAAAVVVAACGATSNSTPPSTSAPATSSASAPATAASSSAPTVRSVVIDTDMAPDDWVAILYLLGRPEVKVEAITVTGAGEAHCGPGVQNALNLIALAGKPDIPVACGRETPLAGSHTFPEPWRDAADSLLGLSIPANPNGPTPGSAVELLTTTLNSAQDKVTLLTLGPLTNIAEALQASPDLAEKIEATYFMGGAVNVGGSVGESGVDIDNQYAEWNVYVDPTATKVAMDAGINLILVPLDATNQAPMTLDFLHRLSADSGTPEAQFVRDVLNQQRDFIASGTYYFWDPLAAAVLVDESFTTFETADLSVVVEEGTESGRIIASPEGAPTRFATSADVGRFEQDSDRHSQRPCPVTPSDGDA